MTRADIGNHLGLAAETVSRILSRFQQHDLIEVSGRELHLLDLDTLMEMSGKKASDGLTERG